MVNEQSLPPPERLAALIDGLASGLLERDQAVRLSLLAALAGEHVLLLGPPGTAKSALARRLHRAFSGARYFERLLTRFSTPEELFGPLSLRALEHDRYERLIDGYLPTAGIAFLDEVFKANSAILNALLTLLNERAFDNGTERLGTPLVCVIGASNELPGDEALAAFHDRFLVRVPVAPVADASFTALLALSADEWPAPCTPVTAGERAALQTAAQSVALGEDFVAGCSALRGWLAARHAPLSDRRWRRFVALARVAAASEGRRTLDVLDLGLAPCVAAPRPEDVAVIEAWFVDELLHSPPEVAPWLARAVEAFERQLDIEQQMQADDAGSNDTAGKLALARAIGRPDLAGATAGDTGPGMQRIVAAGVEAARQRRWGAAHVQARVAQVGEVRAQVQAALCEVAALHATWRDRLQGRLWLGAALAGRVLARHASALALLQDFDARLAALDDGFGGLPVDQEAEEAMPEPVAFDAAD